MDDPIAALRMLERIIAVLIAGSSIYLGYRLFFHLPFERSHEGELELPGIKIVLSRVGPGVFFAAFGTLVLYYSLTNPVKIGSSFVGASGRTHQPATESSTSLTPQQRNKALTTIEMLNCAERLLLREESGEELGDQFSLAIRDAKRALLLSIWNTEEWGSLDELKVSGPSDDAPFQVRTGFNAIYGDCPNE